MLKSKAKDTKILLLHKGASYVDDKNYNIVLSPEFYWCRVFNIPTDSKKQIKKLLPSLFEDILPHPNFEYYATKLNDKKYVCFAYESEKIIDSIKTSGLDISKLQNVYFAQNELFKLAPFKINKMAYIIKDEVLIQVPLTFIGNDVIDLNISNIKLSSNKFNLNIHQKVFNSKNIYILSFILLFLSCINFAAMIYNKSDITKLEKEKDALIEKYHLPKTSIQLNSIIKSSKNSNEVQYKIRDLLNDIFSIYKRYPNIKIQQIKYTDNLFLEISNIDLESLKMQLKKYTIKKLKEDNSSLKVEISL